MKKIIFLFCLLFSFNVYALTLDESKEIANVARGIIEKGMSNEHLDSKGMPILAYMQGEARVYGYAEQLYKINKTYSGSISVNSSKWNFDCASFVSYIFKVTLNMRLLDSNYLGGNPYMVENFMNDNQFTKIYNGLSDSELLSKKASLQPGDLIVIIGSHIGMYVGDGEIAEASNKLIRSYSTNSKYYQGAGNYNLGTGITKLEDFVSDRRYAVLRLNKTLNNGEKVNTIITWPDTLKQEDFGSNSDINIQLEDSNYVKEAKLLVSIDSMHPIIKYAFGKNQNDQYQDVNGELKILINENGHYYLSVIDKYNRKYEKEIEITNIDNTPPMIDNYVYRDDMIYIEAHDDASGLNEKAYSFDNGKTWISNNFYNVPDLQIIEIAVRDRLENVFKKQIAIEKPVSEETNENLLSIIAIIILLIAILVFIVLIINNLKKRKKG